MQLARLSAQCAAFQTSMHTFEGTFLALRHSLWDVTSHASDSSDVADRITQQAYQKVLSLTFDLSRRLHTREFTQENYRA